MCPQRSDNADSILASCKWVLFCLFIPELICSFQFGSDNKNADCWRCQMLLSSEFICWFKRGYEAKDKMLNVFNFLACSSSKVGRGEGLLTSKQIPANIILISLQKKSNVSLLVSIMSTDLLTDTQRGVMKGLENKKCSSFERKEVTVVDWKHEGGKWETEAKMNWVMDKHGEWKHIPFWQLMKGGSKYVETQQTQTHHSAQLGLHFILIRLCRHHSFLQQFIYPSVRSSSVFLFQKELFPHNLTFEKGKSYRFKPQAEQCWGKSSDFNLVWGWCLQFVMNGVPLFFFLPLWKKILQFSARGTSAFSELLSCDLWQGEECV